MELPESYDWREKFPQCAREEAQTVEKECASSYVHASLSAVEDRICMGSGNIVRLSKEELIDCDKTTQGCKGGTVNRALAWGKRKGYVPEECYVRDEDDSSECTMEKVQENECRQV